ncbi:MAG: Cof-type HAD-IIB family hydrolase [Armatimonadota bacterium]|nr:Cof-type HAD-IIB family hydrolase [Armatimonadota bacterium]MDR7402326.1 Cof-type HAD-IIB family hydrolase [Armatimonadota bacterium]MDR7404367.1 Cof-type HAD-IIB family hydrolase [Armatimonadota bacterium]MDR7437311.1 Cof-type HAD-IIB family hydrolase [Armatimonadota bacterium]MDR7472650.1 Cof-type HAD-IIB family hydrolase [Armatimonadota bacterium]
MSGRAQPPPRVVATGAGPAGTPEPGEGGAPRYRLVVADIDGTLVTSTREITPRVRAAVQAARRRGVRVCLATGRMWPSAEPYVRRLGADPPIILYNGGLVYDFATGTVLRRVPLDVDHARAVLDVLREHPEVQPHLYVNDRVYTARPSEITDQYRRKDGIPVEVVGDLRAVLSAPPMKILIIGARPDLERVRARIRQLPRQIHTVFSEDTYLEVLPQGSSKGAALQWMARHLGIPLEQVVAVGDNLNDLEMIQVAGLGVAMGNAPADLKAAADVVTASNDEEGLAEVIERCVLQGTGQDTAPPQPGAAAGS